MIENQFNTSVPNIKCIGDVTFGPMLAHKVEEEGIAAAEHIRSKHGHVNYDTIPSVVYAHSEVARVGKTEQELKKDGVRNKVGQFSSLANFRAKTNLGIEGQVKLPVDEKSDRILDVVRSASDPRSDLSGTAISEHPSTTCFDLRPFFIPRFSLSLSPLASLSITGARQLRMIHTHSRARSPSPSLFLSLSLYFRRRRSTRSHSRTAPVSPLYIS